mgnify:FL=1
MEIEFIKTSPTQNMTVLVKTPVPREKQLALAERLIAYDNVYAEQAGYIEEPENPQAAKHLQMMAGEFCGNASLSLAAWLAQKDGLAAGETREYLLEVSGTEGLVPCEITREECGFFGKAKMPLPERIEERTFRMEGEELRLIAVVFEGITHVIVPAGLWKEDTERKAETAARLWAEELPDGAAFGLLLLDENEHMLRPLVYLKGVSMIWERGCGSGTAAVGAYLAWKNRKAVSVELQQPGGKMRAEAGYQDGVIPALYIAGHVSIVAEGIAFLEG